jgi:hypothetical protein
MAPGSSFLGLVMLIVFGPYLCRVPPRTVADWRALTSSVAFAIWCTVGVARLISW